MSKENNWIEVKSLTEQTLKEKAADVWHDARSAIRDCCESFRKHYDGTLDDKPENGIRIKITRLFPPGASRFETSSSPRKTCLTAEFNERIPCIEVMVDEGTTRVFKISADQAHAFIVDKLEEISVDTFTKLAMERFLFDPPKAPRSAPASAPPSAYS